MWGLLMEAEGRRCRWGVERIAGLRFFAVYLPRRRGLLRRLTLLRAAKWLQKAGVRRCVFPEGLAENAAFLRRGIRPVEPLPLLRRLAAPWALCELKGRGVGESCTAAVAADRWSRDVEESVTALALRLRYAAVDCPGSERLARTLRGEYGVSLRSPTRERLEQAEALVLFAPRPELRQKNPVVLRLYPGGAQALPTLLAPPKTEADLPAGADRPALLCALWQGGALRAEEIQVKSFANFS